MKLRNLSIILVISLFFTGCVVYSFYPLYTEKDLFANDILTGEWVDEDGTSWSFKHPYKGNKKSGVIDSTSYVLRYENEDGIGSTYYVHVVELSGSLFLDFYLDKLPLENEADLSAFHAIPVHTFAKLKKEDGKLIINWFDQEWMADLINENKIRIHHENNGDFILLTAKPRELQKFVTKYVNSEEAFENGLSVVLSKK